MAKPETNYYEEDVWDEDLDGGTVPSGRVLSYGAIGLGWQLLRQEFGTWVLATFVMGLIIPGLIVASLLMFMLHLIEDCESDSGLRCPRASE